MIQKYAETINEMLLESNKMVYMIEIKKSNIEAERMLRKISKLYALLY